MPRLLTARLRASKGDLELAPVTNTWLGLFFALPALAQSANLTPLAAAGYRALPRPPFGVLLTEREPLDAQSPCALRLSALSGRSG